MPLKLGVMVAIVGGIAAGKSAVAERFAAHGLRRTRPQTAPAALLQIFGSIGIGRIKRGTLRRGASVAVVDRDGKVRTERVPLRDRAAQFKPRLRTTKERDRNLRSNDCGNSTS